MQQQKSTLKRQIIKKQCYFQKLKLLKGKGRKQECAVGSALPSGRCLPAEKGID